MPEICVFNSSQFIGTIVSTFIGGIIGFCSAVYVSNRNARYSAVAKLRASFAPAQAKLFQARGSGERDLREFFDTVFMEHATAIEEFRPFVCKCKLTAYQQTWNEYKKTIYDDDDLGDARLRWNSGEVINTTGADPLNFLEVIKQKINNILSYT